MRSSGRSCDAGIAASACSSSVAPRALEAAARELLASRRNDAQRPGISELRLQNPISSTGWLMQHTVSEPQRQVLGHPGHPLLQEPDQQVVHVGGGLLLNGVAGVPRYHEG